MMLREKLKKLLEKSIKELQKEEVFFGFKIPEIELNCPTEKDYGDYSTNIAMVIARDLKKKPMEIASLISLKLKTQNSKLLERVEIAKPGFINFFISKEYLQKQVADILQKKEEFGQLAIGKNKKINLEFISANPTGPLTLGNGRGGFCGDVLASVLARAGYKVTREYYINDTGEQVRKLGHSVIGDDQAVYKGKYIEELRKKIKKKSDPEKTGEKAAQIILKQMIKPSVKKMKIKFDLWFSEKSLYQSGQVDRTLKLLKNKGLAYEKEGALWFKSTKFGDDKDRVLIKSSGQTTYLASDFAYLNNKFKRGFNKLIYIWGADHFGYILRVKAAAQALGYEKKDVEIIIMQMVKLFEKEKEVKMSKRLGTYVTLDELIDQVGLDAARFFFLTRKAESHLNFDLDLAKEQSEKNPVYYVQYAHARICSILGKKELSSFLKRSLAPFGEAENLKLLKHPSELALIKQLIRLPEVIEETAKDYQVQRIPQYALDVAANFHQFYRDCRVLPEIAEVGSLPSLANLAEVGSASKGTCFPLGSLVKARLGLILATKNVLKNTLELMGIFAPQKM